MSSATPPVIVIVPGAFGTPQGFARLLPYLTKAGYATHPGAYPSCNPSDPAQVSSSAQDIAFLRDTVLLPLLNEHGKDVVIVAHSYGGVVAGGAAKGLAKGTSRQTGVLGLVYVAGNITLEGESLLAAVGGAYPPFIKANKVGLPEQP
jgi:pimeloyl-ACP methyl ester carboxylesterase